MDAEYTKTFNKAFERVIRHEGEYQNGHADRGNWTGGKVGIGELRGTKYGISAMSYPTVDIKNLTLGQAKGIYWSDWWLPLNMKILTPAMRYQMFDAAINSGRVTATKLLQNSLLVSSDGVIGPKTKAAMAKADGNDILLRFLAERLYFMTNIGTWSTYGKGWARRISENLIIASSEN